MIRNLNFIVKKSIKRCQLMIANKHKYLNVIFPKAANLAIKYPLVSARHPSMRKCIAERNNKIRPLRDGGINNLRNDFHFIVEPKFPELVPVRQVQISELNPPHPSSC